MNRRTLLSTLAGFFVGKKVVAQEIEFTPISRPPDTQTIAWLNQMYANLQKDYSTVWDDRPASDYLKKDGHKISSPLPEDQGEEWNRRWDEGRSV